MLSHMTDKTAQDPGQFMELDDDNTSFSRRASLGVNRLISKASRLFHEPSSTSSSSTSSSRKNSDGSKSPKLPLQISEPVLLNSSSILGTNPATRPFSSSATTEGSTASGRNSAYSSRHSRQSMLAPDNNFF